MSVASIAAAFAISFVAAASSAVLATSSGTTTSGPWTDNGSVYYCLINTEQVIHTQTNNYLVSQTVARRSGLCGSSAHPAVIRGQLVGWRNGSICFAGPLGTPAGSAWATSDPFNLPLVNNWVFSFGALTGPAPDLPCGNGNYAVGGGHEGWSWPGTIESWSHLSGSRYLRNHYT